MAKSYSHVPNIIQRTKTILKAKKLKPGSVVEFRYASGKGDDKPLVLILANGYYDDKANSKKNILIHGINFNYLQNAHITKLKGQIEKRPIMGQKMNFTKEKRDDRGRYVIEENRYTRLSLPIRQYYATKETELGIAHLRTLMKMLYTSAIEKIAEKYDCYRTYAAHEMNNIRGILYKF